MPSIASSALSCLNQVEKLEHARACRKLVREALHSGFGGRLALRADVDGACQILANEDRGEPWSAAGSLLEISGGGGDLFAHRRCGSAPVDPLGGHTVV
jgi:hypothetical protein